MTDTVPSPEPKWPDFPLLDATGRPLQGTKTLLIGGPGSGKTHALRTLAEAGLNVFMIATEPNAIEILDDTDPEHFHWQYIPPLAPSFATLMESAKKINTMSYEDLTKQKDGMNKRDYQQFLQLLVALDTTQCTRCGKSFGPAEKLGNNWAIVLDSLSGVNIMALDLVTGAKPVKHQGEWGVAMENEERLINTLASGSAFFILIAHAEPERDEVSGATTIMAGALGRKLAPKLPRFFSDVIHCKRQGAGQFVWSTITTGMDLKARNLKWEDGLTPSFRPIVENWLRKNAAYKAGTPTQSGIQALLPGGSPQTQGPSNSPNWR